MLNLRATTFNERPGMSPSAPFCIFPGVLRILLFLPALLAPAWGQDALALRDAVRLALRENKSLAAAAAGMRASDDRIAQAHSGVLPKVNYSQSFTRSDNPVFVFSSLLTQHQFSAANFNIGPLNRPDFLNNFQSQLTVDQVLYDAGQTRNSIKSAELGRKMTSEEQRGIQLQVIFGVAQAYYQALLTAETLKAAEQAVRSAEADLTHAEAIRSAGMSTDVDVLSVRVHLAAVGEQRINRSADLDVAKAALNDALGLPLDTPHTLTTALTPLSLPDFALDTLETEAAATRPEAQQIRIAIDLAQTQVDAAHGTRRPQVSFRSAVEADAQRFVTRGGINWLASVEMKWNLFDGFERSSHLAESGHWVERAKAEEQRTDSSLRLQVRRAYAGLRAARQRIEVAKASVAESEESLRITQNRYAAGFANVTDLLRNETAVLESRTRYLAAVHDQRVAATMLEFAAGRLSPDSEVLN
jgi:outer membrane protein